MSTDHPAPKVPLDALFGAEGSPGSIQMFQLLSDRDVAQVTVNSHDRIFYVDQRGAVKINTPIWATAAEYVDWLNVLLRFTDAGFADIRDARTHVIEGSFTHASGLFGSVHICLPEITRGEPILTVRKQPPTLISLDEMLAQKMMSAEMRLTLEALVRGRANLLVSGGSGAGKTTLLRALSQFIDPMNRVITVEDTAELNLTLADAPSLTTFIDRDPDGRIVRDVGLTQLVKEALRMRPDRIWVGETRGAEAYALTKAALSGHDGAATTIHADDPQQAVKQLVSYVLEAGVPEEAARDQVARAFHVVVQVARISPTRRAITAITEIEPVRETGTEQRRNPLYLYDHQRDAFVRHGAGPSPRLRAALARYGVNFSELSNQLAGSHHG